MNKKSFQQKFSKQQNQIQNISSDEEIALQVDQPKKQTSHIPVKATPSANIFHNRISCYSQLKEKSQDKHVSVQSSLESRYGFIRVPSTASNIVQVIEGKLNNQPISSSDNYKFRKQIEKKRQEQIAKRNKDFEKKKQVQRQKNLQKKRQQKEQKMLKKKEEQKQKKKEINSLLDNLMGMHDSQSDASKKGNEGAVQLGLRNQQILKNLDDDRDYDYYAPDFQDQQEKKAMKRHYFASLVGTDQIVNGYKPQSSQTLIRLILNHDFHSQSSIGQGKRIPPSFDSPLVYVKTFHYLLANECIADLQQRLSKLQKNDFNEVVDATIINTRKSIDGFTQILLRQKIVNNGTQIGGTTNDRQKFLLKNYSLSKNRLGLITNKIPFRKKNYGVPSRNNNRQFSFLCMLLTPQTKEDLNFDVKAICSAKQFELELIMKQNKSNEVYFIDMEKLSTTMRQYKAVSDLPLFNLAPFILKPRIMQGHQADIIKNREVLNPILNILQKQYNEVQYNSIRQMALRQYGVVMLQGPPGTGKTSTLLGLLAAQYQYFRAIGSQLKILVCAPSNAAIDHITRRIATEGLLCGKGLGQIVKPAILRTGIVESDDTHIAQVSLDHICQRQMNKIREHNMTTEMSTPAIKQKLFELQKELKKLIIECKVKPSSDAQEAIKRKKQDIVYYDNQMFQFRRQKVVLKSQYSEIEKKCLDSAQIILTTLSSSGAQKVDRIKGKIGCLIVDEAAQATEPNLLIALQTGVQKVLLIGDPYQLPATVISSDTANTLFNRSLFQRFLDAGLKPYFLSIQYRMVPMIREFPSKKFYNDRLKDSQTINSRQTPKQLESFTGRNVLFLDINFDRDRKQQNSYINEGQSFAICQFLRKVRYDFSKIGIITPYQSQKRNIGRYLRKRLPQRQPQLQKLMINTVDSFQGQQKDIIIISCVRSNQEGNIGFMVDQRRSNVALTRAKFLMVVVGNGNTLGSNQIWDSFLSFCQKNQSYYRINFKSECQKIIESAIIGKNQVQIKRKEYQKKSRDNRKEERLLIKSNDFASNKKVKHNQYEYNGEQMPVGCLKTKPIQISEHSGSILKTPKGKQVLNSYPSYQYKPSSFSRLKDKNDKIRKRNFDQKKNNSPHDSSNKILSTEDMRKVLDQKKSRLQQGFKFDQVTRNVNQIQKKIKNGQIQDEFLKQLYK